MKKLIKFIFAFIIMFSLYACGEDPKPIDDDTNIKVTNLVIANSISRLEVGSEYELSARIEPSNATNKNVNWSSSNLAVLSIDNNGKIKALSEGKSIITVSSTDGTNLKDEIEIEVYAIEISNPELIVDDMIELFIGEEKTIVTELVNSSNEIIYTTDSNLITLVGNKITAKTVGECKVIVSAGELTKEVTVIIKANVLEIVGEASVTEGDVKEYKLLVNGEEKEALWVSNEANLATISSNGILTALAEGSVVIKAIYSTLEEVQMTIEIKTNVIKPTEITLSCNINDDTTIYIDTEIKLDYEITPSNASKSVVFLTSDDSIAKVDKNGNVRFYKGGSVVITVRSALTKAIKASITLTSLPYVDPMNFFVKYNVGTVAQQYCVNACYDRKPYPITLLSGCISYYYFEPFNVITTYAYEPFQDGLVYSYGLRTSTWFITVHDAGGVSSGYSLANYAKGSARNEEKSWHYSVGSDGIYKGLNEDYGGWHAGSGAREVDWIDTGVEANPLEPHATVSISSDQYWIVAGVKTNLKVTPVNPGAKGCPSRFTNSDLPYTGINTRISYTGTYLISSVWWSSDYATLSNCGGNTNSIGMESEVGEDADLEVTWHHIAQLCADIIVRRNLVLGVDAIVQHNTFSGKNCPQTMREAGRWEYFKKMAEAEFYARKYMRDFNFELICNSELVNSYGQVIKFPEKDTVITYQVRVTSTKYNYDQTTAPIEVIIPDKI